MKKTNPVKEALKKIVPQIKQAKLDLKDAQRNNTADWKTFRNVYVLKKEFRHKHIAYCLVKGRKYEEIEQPLEGNEPSFPLIEHYQIKMTEMLNEFYGPKVESVGVSIDAK